jgi:hypothetical protein
VSLLAFMIAAAVAAPTTKDRESDYSAVETRKLVWDYAQCVIRGQQQPRASDAILANVGNDELLHKYPSLIDGKCLPVRAGAVIKARFQGDQFRYALADALVRKELASAPALDFEPLPLLDHRLPFEPARFDKTGRPLKAKAYEEAVEGYERAKAFAFISRYGECVVRTDPSAARSLLLTDPGTAQEAQQFASMTNALGTCLREGETLSFGKLALRGTIAINYYRLTKAALQQPASGAAR